MAWALPLEAAIAVETGTVLGVTLPSIVAIFQGLTATQLESDIQLLSNKLTQVNRG